MSDDENKTYFLDGMNVLKHNKLILPEILLNERTMLEVILETIHATLLY